MKNMGSVIVLDLHSNPQPFPLNVVFANENHMLLINNDGSQISNDGSQSEVYVCILQHVNSFAGPDTAEHSSWRVELGNCGLRCRRVRNTTHIYRWKMKRMCGRI